MFIFQELEDYFEQLKIFDGVTTSSRSLLKSKPLHSSFTIWRNKKLGNEAQHFTTLKHVGFCKIFLQNCNSTGNFCLIEPVSISDRRSCHGYRFFFTAQAPVCLSILRALSLLALAEICWPYYLREHMLQLVFIRDLTPKLR